MSRSGTSLTTRIRNRIKKTSYITSTIIIKTFYHYVFIWQYFSSFKRIECRILVPLKLQGRSYLQIRDRSVIQLGVGLHRSPVHSVLYTHTHTHTHKHKNLLALNVIIILCIQQVCV